MLVAAAVLIGASVGAATHAASPRHDRAQALLVVSPPSGSNALARTRSNLVSAALRTPYAAAAANEIVGLPESPDELAHRVDVSADRPSSGLVAITASGPSADRAAAAANAYAFVGGEVLDQVRTGSIRAEALGSFEQGLGAWHPGGSSFTSPAMSFEVGTGGARYGRGFLTVMCGAATDCGAWTHAFYPFRAGGRYTVTGWARLGSPARGPGASAAAFIGANRSDGRLGAARSLTPDWQRFSATWRARQSTTGAEVGFAIDSLDPGETVRVDLDGVALQDRTGQASTGQLSRVDERLFGHPPLATTFQARPIGFTSASATVWWALGGAALGLAVGAAGVGSARAAARRTRRGSRQ